jgi:leader peptidase (prepilin peptidase)/N-methyltransferase
LSVLVAVVTALLSGVTARAGRFVPGERVEIPPLPGVLAAAAGSGLAAGLATPEAWPFAAVAGGILTQLAAIDAATYRLPDRLTLPFFLFAAAFGPPEPTLRLAGCPLAAALLWATAIFFRRLRGRDGLGFGDVKLAAGCGAMIGAEAVGPMLLLAAGLALAFILAHRLLAAQPATLVGVGQPIAFGPWLAASTFVIALAQAQRLLI